MGCNECFEVGCSDVCGCDCHEPKSILSGHCERCFNSECKFGACGCNCRHHWRPCSKCEQERCDSTVCACACHDVSGGPSCKHQNLHPFRNLGIWECPDCGARFKMESKPSKALFDEHRVTSLTDDQLRVTVRILIGRLGYANFIEEFKRVIGHDMGDRGERGFASAAQDRHGTKAASLLTQVLEHLRWLRQ